MDELLTPRLRLRRWRAADEPLMAAINQDPEVTRYLNRPVDAAAIASFYALVAEHWATHDFGFWAVETREPDPGGEFIGFVGVGYPAFLPELATRPELGWRLGVMPGGAALQLKPPSRRETTPSTSSNCPS